MNFQPIDFTASDIFDYNAKVKNLNLANDYLDMIGKPQHHLQSLGKLCSLKVTTEINYQDSPGTTNYWKEPVFDDYLVKVITKRFDELSKEAVALMQQDCKKALDKLKDVVPSIQRQLEIQKEN